MTKKQPSATYSLDEIRGMIARGEDRTDWTRVDAKTEADLAADIVSDPEADLVGPAERFVLVPEGYEVRLVKKTA